eukprot:scaffold9100_cov15-Tisochrysis_lutea.AAC.1
MRITDAHQYEGHGLCGCMCVCAGHGPAGRCLFAQCTWHTASAASAASQPTAVAAMAAGATAATAAAARGVPITLTLPASTAAVRRAAAAGGAYDHHHDAAQHA